MMAVRAAALLAISYGLGGIVQNEWQLLAMRAFQGFAAGLWPACLAILSSSVPKTKLGFALGTMQGGLTAGGVIGRLPYSLFLRSRNPKNDVSRKAGQIHRGRRPIFFVFRLCSECSLLPA